MPEIRTCLAMDAVEDPIPEVWSDDPQDLADLRASLRRIQELGAAFVLPAHGWTSSPELVDRNIAYFDALAGRTRGLGNDALQRSDLATLSGLRFVDLLPQLAQLASLRFRKIQLGLKQASILNHLLGAERATLTEIAEITLSDLAAASRAVASLQKAGLVKKAADPHDSRKLIIALTAAGRRKAATGFDIRASIFAEFERTLSLNEITELCRLLGLAAQALHEARTAPKEKHA